MPATPKVWQLVAPNPHSADHLAYSLRISPVLAQLLANRGVTTADEARLFLDAPMVGLHAPSTLPGVAAAAVRVCEAIRAGDRICVYGDYDVDGTTATAILLNLFKIAGADAEFYIPNRAEEGYGLNADAVRKLAASGVGLVVTVDCGITRADVAAVARSVNLPLIITDHHEFAAALPDADALVHPRLPWDHAAYPNGDLCGAGVAFKLAWAVALRLSNAPRVAPPFREYLLDAMALVALGLVADVMPLRGENRVLVAHGLKRLLDKPSVGLKALLEAAGLLDKPTLKAEDIGFRLAPRINAAGRLDCARLVVELLTTHNPIRAREIAERLEELNAKRKGIEAKITEQACDLVEAEGYDAHAGLVVASDGWHGGVIGIVASRLAERYGKPALVIAWGPDGEVGSGSGRSVAGFPLHEALNACTADLLSHGGHAAAAGFRLKRGRVDALRARFAAYVSTHFDGVVPPARLLLDGEVPLTSLTFNLLDDLARLEPFGQDNARPRFLATGLRLDGEPKLMGADKKHMSFRVKQGRTAFRAVAFNMADRANELTSAGGECCLAFNAKLNEYEGRRSVEMEVIDLRAGGDPRLG